MILVDLDVIIFYFFYFKVFNAKKKDTLIVKL
jgi:hypothetical protein